MNITIQSPRLTIEIAEPGAVYNRTRFDWTAFITQVTLDGQHTFCVPEDYDPTKGTGGIGLSNEFGIEKPIGYDDAASGESFPKLGIGLLKKTDEGPYNFFRPYDLVEKFPVDITTRPDSATFIVHPIECRGYAARLTKTVRVASNNLEVSYTLENTGKKAIATHEYMHNFVGIDRHPIGPDYRLHLAHPIELKDMRPAFRKMAPPMMRKLLPNFILDKIISSKALKGMQAVVIRGNDFGFRASPRAPFYCRPLSFSSSNGPQWEITHLPSQVGLREYDDFTPWRVAVWGTTHVISAEIFIDINLQPGETQRWTRRYEFFHD